MYSELKNRNYANKSTTLKAQIDSEITNETVDFAITPAEVGGRMKDVVDYTTEQSALKEDLTNKSTDVTTDGASDTKYPSVKAVKTYVDANAGALPYNFWRAEVKFDSVVNVFYDGIGFTSPTVSNPSNGNIILTKTGFFTGIDTAKIDFLSDNIYNSGSVFITKAFQGGTFGENPDDKVLLRVFDMAGSQSSTPPTSCVIEIRIYN